jgi:hypothetical protein
MFYLNPILTYLNSFVVLTRKHLKTFGKVLMLMFFVVNGDFDGSQSWMQREDSL